MPSKDGTGPRGTGPVTGQGQGQGRGQGRGGGMGFGPGGQCVCTKCGEKTSHKAGTPCFETKCPKCGAPMVRGSAGGDT